MQHPMPMDGRSEAQRLHRAINWVISVILIGFAIWSIQLNAQGRGMLKQTTSLIEASDAKIDKIVSDLQVVKEACQATPVVIPLPTTDTQTKQ